METDEAARLAPRADPSTVLNKLLVGYQGWSSCPDDSGSSSGWNHWFTKSPSEGGTPVFDFWPDLSEYDESELCDVPNVEPSRYRAGASGQLFSSTNRAVVSRHFRQMAAHRIDGALFQRWGNQCLVPEAVSGRAINPNSITAKIARERDLVLDNVRRGAEASERVFAVMYDLTAMDPKFVPDTILGDWIHLMRDLRILESSSYLKHEGAAVLALGGVGFASSGQHPHMIQWLISELRKRTPGGLWVVLCTSTSWRSGDNDQDPTPGWMDTYLSSADAICPWTVRRYNDEDSADHFSNTVVRDDVRFLKANSSRKLSYIPTVFPGFSMGNAMQMEEAYNEIPRQGGLFLWRQLMNAQRHNPPFIYAAMFDEFESGTALMSTIPKADHLPRSGFKFLSLDIDGSAANDLPPDWYLRICGMAAVALKNEMEIDEVMPNKRLFIDYWHTRPRRKEGSLPIPEASGSGSGGASGSGGGSSSQNRPAPRMSSDSRPSSSGARTNTTGSGMSSHEAQVAQAFAAVPEQGDDEPPPPPYSLMSEGEEPTAPSATAATPSASSPEVSQASDPGSDYLARLTSTLGSVSLADTSSASSGFPSERPTSPPTSSSPPASTGFIGSPSSSVDHHPVSHVTTAALPTPTSSNPYPTYGAGPPGSDRPPMNHAQTLPTPPPARPSGPAWAGGPMPNYGAPLGGMPNPASSMPSQTSSSGGSHPQYSPTHSSSLPPMPASSGGYPGGPSPGTAYPLWAQGPQSPHSPPPSTAPVAGQNDYSTGYPYARPGVPGPNSTYGSEAPIGPGGSSIPSSTRPNPQAWGPEPSSGWPSGAQNNSQPYPGAGPSSYGSPHPPPSTFPTPQHSNSWGPEQSSGWSSSIGMSPQSSAQGPPAPAPSSPYGSYPSGHPHANTIGPGASLYPPSPHNGAGPSRPHTPSGWQGGAAPGGGGAASEYYNQQQPGYFPGPQAGQPGQMSPPFQTSPPISPPPNQPNLPPRPPPRPSSTNPASYQMPT
ncbi:hypothetical protein DL93DRAFT_2170926 [Clavulina sp. PMI_390]|nr:hypothetical protein DL93DRAFT_2170926 [Clavulina sp. PMI_390]